MSLSNGSFEFSLRRGIEVHGVEAPVELLTFTECGEGYDTYYMKLRKHVTSAQMKAPEMMDKLRSFIKPDDLDTEAMAGGVELKKPHEVDDTDHETEANGFAEFLKLMLGTSDELEELVKVFGFMVSNKGGVAICTAEGIRVNEVVWKRLHIEDKIDAAVKYCAFFGIGLDKPAKKEFAVVSDSPTEVKAL